MDMLTGRLAIIFTSLHQLVDHIGFNGPIIISIIVLYFLRKNSSYLYAFILGSCANVFLNKILKIFFRQNRPDGAVISDQEPSSFYTGEEQYGMPSGHMQIAAFALVYYYLLKRNWTITMILLLITILTFYQRLVSRHHTIEQLFTGLTVGSVFAYLLFGGLNRYLSKKEFV